MELLTDNMLKPENVKGFFVEGFPRELNQARLFEEVVSAPPVWVMKREGKCDFHWLLKK